MGSPRGRRAAPGVASRPSGAKTIPRPDTGVGGCLYPAPGTPCRCFHGGAARPQRWAVAGAPPGSGEQR